MEDKKKPTLFERYLTKEIGIEFKACLYFFALLFFYCVYRVATGGRDAGILHMAEMIVACYIICYIQVYAFGNFDESDELGGKEWLGVALCTAVYSLLSYFLGWFEKNILLSCALAGYWIVVYLCVFLIYRFKRRIDDRMLNEELKIFQSEHKKVQDKDE